MKSSHAIAIKVIEAISWGRCIRSNGLTDFAPLVSLMYHVAAEIERRGGSFDKPKARKVWLKAMAELQEGNGWGIEQNHRVPCRYCNRAFWPVIDEQLLELF